MPEVVNGAAGSSRVGQFRWETETGRWQWSAGMYAIHGYPGPAVTPTSDLVLQHKSPHHRLRAETVFADARRQPGSYSNYHQIVDVNGTIRTVLTVGSSKFTSSDGLVAVGYMADITDAERDASTQAVVAATAHRTAINQAQGAIMAVLGLDATAAHALLIWYSQTYNTKLAALSTRLVNHLAGHGAVTAHEQLTTLLLDAATPPPSSDLAERDRLN